MKMNASVEPLPAAPLAESLAVVLDKSEQIQDVIEECADTLSSVNLVLKDALVHDAMPPPGVEVAIDSSEAIEDKVHEAAVALAEVNRALEVEVRERQQLEQQLADVIEDEKIARFAAFHDPLTGLPNRALFKDRLEHALAQATRHHGSLAVMFIDLDDFKLVNDVHGHDAGDQVLRTIGTRLRDSTRADDTVSRYGGDEFLYLLMAAGSEAETARIARKLFELIKQPCAISARGEMVEVTIAASIGIAVFQQDGVTADTLVKVADCAMYAAKQQKSGWSFAVRAGT
jgi:diguanylate cyclase (GGDEF)-like protein